MVTISYAACSGLSLIISAEFALEMCLAAENRQKIHKTPYFCVQGPRLIQRPCLGDHFWIDGKAFSILKLEFIRQLMVKIWWWFEDSEYGGPIWAPVISNTNWKHLQVIQNEALPTATSCYHMASTDHLHQETKVLPLCTHRDLLTKQYMLRCHMPCHPGNKHLNRPLPPRLMKNDLDTQLQRPFQSGELASYAEKCSSTNEYKSCLRAIHITCVAQTVAGYERNKVLNTTASEIHSSEIELPRKARTFLAQLRSGYCAWQNSYK